jgi:hypothetical protein
MMSKVDIVLIKPGSQKQLDGERSGFKMQHIIRMAEKKLEREHDAI